VSRSELVTNPLTGKLKQVVDERPHAPVIPEQRS
jgi:hypothetical protein